MIYRQEPLSDISHRFREIWKVTGGTREWEEYRLYLSRMAELNTYLFYAEDSGRIVATVGFRLDCNDQLQDKITALGVDPLTVQSARSFVYTHPEFRGQGIGSKLENMVNKVSQDSGYKYRIALGYDTEAIYKWTRRLEGVRELRVEGVEFPSTLIPLTIK